MWRSESLPKGAEIMVAAWKSEGGGEVEKAFDTKQ